MGFRLKGFLAVILGSLAIFTWLLYYSITSDQVRTMPLEAEQGKRIFQKKGCVECHTLFGNGGYSGGDLTKIYEKLGRDGLKDYLTHPPVISGAKKKRHDSLTEEEADQITAYFYFVNSIDTNWPP